MFSGKVFESLGSVFLARMRAHTHRLVQTVFQFVKACVCNVWDCMCVVYAHECGFA